MQDFIKELLNDLYAADPSLQQYEIQLINTITIMLKNRPDTKFDQQFKNELRNQILAQAQQLKKQAPQQSFFASLKFWQGLSVVSVAAVIVLLIVLPQFKLQPTSTLSLNPQDAVYKADSSSLLASQPQIEKVAAEGFGSLAASSQGTISAPANEGTSSQSSISRDLGFGGGAADSPVPAKLSPDGIVNFKYIYEGGDLPTLDKELLVYKRLKIKNDKDFSSWLSALNLGLVDASKFSNLKVNHLAFVEDKDQGYIIDITPSDGLLSITQNWERWQIDYSNLPQLKLSDIPADEKLISLANDFLKKYNISLSLYGQPEVDASWRVAYNQMAGSAEAYIPNVISVRYPLKMQDKQVFDQSGGPAGIFVQVNVYNMKIEGVYGLATQNYQSSLYQMETDIQRIVKIAELGGFGQPYLGGEGDQTIEIKLGQPTLQYLQYWQFSDNKNNELLIPAYVFPVISNSDQNYAYIKNVIVPVAKEILDSQDNFNGAVPMPLIEPKINN